MEDSTPPQPAARRPRAVKSPEDRPADIFAAAQIGKGTCYRRFPSKDHLLDALGHPGQTSGATNRTARNQTKR